MRIDVYKRQVISGRGTTAQRFSVPHLLDVAQAAGDAAVTVGVEGVEVDGHTGVAAGVDFSAFQNGLHGAIHDLGRGGAVGVDEVGALVGLSLIHISMCIRDSSRTSPSRSSDSMASRCSSLASASISGER